MDTKYKFSQPRQKLVWPQPFADAYGGRLSPGNWLVVIIGFVLVHLAALQIAQLIGSFQPGPNLDHFPGMQQILKQGYPESMHVPPGFSYYLAFKWTVTRALGLPYWSGKYFIDIFPIVLSGFLTILLTRLLTGNRFIAVVSGFSLVCAPVYILGVGIEDKGFFFYPFFITSLLLLVRELQREKGPRIWHFALSGIMMGAASLIRGNSQFIFIALAPFVLWILRRQSVSRWPLRGAILLSVFLSAQILVMLPWSLLQRSSGEDGIMAAPGVYQGYFWAVRRNQGNRISDWLAENYSQPERSFKGVIGFNLKWLKKDPPALARLYLLQLIRGWYISESARWDKFILIAHLPFWVLGILGLWSWQRKIRGDPAFIFILTVIVYLGVVGALVGGIARHNNFIYGFIGIAIGVFFLSFLQKANRR